MYTLTIKRFFEAAHRLPDSHDLVTKQCANLHGHTYFCQVEIRAKNNSSHGMVVDFKKVKECIDKLDHTFINDIFLRSMVWQNEPTTAENIAKWICFEIEFYCNIPRNAIYVKLCEGYKGPELSNYVSYGD